MTWTIHKASAEWGVDRRTLRKRLSDAGIDIDEKKEFTTQEITQAIVGDLTAERIRETRARADLLEMERKQKMGESVSMSEVQKLISDSLQPVRDLLNAMPTSYGSRVNPTDPEHGTAALAEAVKAILPTIRDELPKPKADE